MDAYNGTKHNKLSIAAIHPESTGSVEFAKKLVLVTSLGEKPDIICNFKTGNFGVQPVVEYLFSKSKA